MFLLQDNLIPLECTFYSVVFMSCSYKNLLKTPRTGKEVVERLLEFFTAFVMLWIGWHVIAWIASFSGILIK